MQRSIIAIAVLLLIGGSLAFALGDLTRNNPIEIKLHMGTQGAHMYFRPDHLTFETGRAYKLVLINDDLQKHELESTEFAEKIFTRKVEVVSSDGGMLAEIKGAVREIEVGPKGTVEWFFVALQPGDEMEMWCAIQGHKEAGMHGHISIK